MKSKHSKIERIAYNAIDKISEKLELEVSFYPRVYLVDKNTKFKSLNLAERHRECFKEIKRERKNVYLRVPKVILIGNPKKSFVAEEAGHFLHYTLSGIKHGKRNAKDFFALQIIVEMIGFFCSKLLYPDRKNGFGKYPDIIDSREECIKTVNKKIGAGFDIKYFTLYQQGYGLGEKLFEKYSNGEISNKEINKIFTHKFEEENKTIEAFLGLKYNLVEYLKLKI